MPPIRRFTGVITPVITPDQFRIGDYLHDPTMCPICEAKPSRPVDLGRHMLVHALNPEELKIGCPHCEGRFLQPSNLTSHMKRHYRQEEHICGEIIFSDEYPYLAIACPFKDIETGGLARHKQNVHGLRTYGVVSKTRSSRRRVSRKVKKVNLKDAHEFPTSASRRHLPLPIYDIPASALKKPLPYTLPGTFPEAVAPSVQEVPNVTLDVEAPVTPVPDVVLDTASNLPVQPDAGSDTNSVLLSGSLDDLLSSDCSWPQMSSPLAPELEPAYTGAGMNAKLALSLDSSDYGLFPSHYQDNVFDFSYGQGVASYPTGDYLVASGSTLPNQVSVDHSYSLPHTPVTSDLASQAIDWHTMMADLDSFSDLTSSPASSTTASFESDAGFFNSDYTNFADFAGYTNYSMSYPTTNNYNYTF